MTTGGPAFPDGSTNQWGNPTSGMTLRDYFAAKALLAGWAADKPPAYDNATRAKYAYEMADAMLEARK